MHTPDMTTLGSQVLTGLQALALPLNIAALLAGALAGALLGTLFQRIGVSVAAALVLLMPLATTLDPATGLILLAACLTAALIATAHHHPAVDPMLRHHNVPLIALAAALAIMLASASTAALVQAIGPADRLALLACGAAAAIALAAVSHPAGWSAAIGLTVAGIIVQLSPLAPLDTERTSPIPLLFGLLIIGPAILALALPQRIKTSSTTLGELELAATFLPALLLGIPATRGVSAFVLDLGENGLAMGPLLMTQRPKLVLAFVVATVLAALLTMAARIVTDHAPRASWWPRWQPATAIRLSSGVIAALGITALYLSGFTLDLAEPAPTLMLLVTALLGAIAAFFGLELAPLVTGLVIGQLMRQPLDAALTQSDGSAFGAMTSGSKPLLLVAALMIATALAGPLIARRLQRSTVN